ncbi:hypothetical protein [Jeotgalibacillus aurantiacus]|uniref:hypothetical protein n=1 Tax=Jeotgalibacillus aurantiacus TaxID=2763266 RepID=UPI001D0B8BA9|nr:hypothetical protein [Jeotgalibacillus aurantiacus]
MLTNVLIGLVLPGILTLYLFKQNPKIIILMYPLGIAIAFTSNDWGSGLYWTVSPVYEKNGSLSAFPYNVGYFPFIASLFGYLNIKNLINSHWLILLFSITFTSLELMAVFLDKISYHNGWNIFFTFFVYLVGYTGAHLYMIILKKYKVL